MIKRNLAKQPTSAVLQALNLIGARLRTARIRRRMTLEEMAKRIGVERHTIADAEKGKPTTAIGVYFSMIWMMGLEREFKNMLDPDEDHVGLTLARFREPERVRHKKPENGDMDNDF